MGIIYAVNCLTFIYLTAACPPDRFGDGCIHKCHCHGCNSTGLCDDLNCITGWYGPQCNDENLITSFNATTVSVVPDQPFEPMIDDNDETCLEISNMSQIVIDFESPVYFTHVRLYGDTGLDVNIALSLLSKDETGPNCTVTSKKIIGNNIVDYLCNPNGNVTGIVLDIMTLKRVCSLYVSRACDSGKTGPSCQFDCKNCESSECSYHNGQCTLGCEGYQNFPFCNETCTSGFYGVNCSYQCNKGCFGNSCDQTTGLCTDGCDGFQDPQDCTIPCNGTSGYNCLCELSCKMCQPKSEECQVCNDNFELDTHYKTCKSVPLKKVAQPEARVDPSDLSLIIKIVIVSLVFLQVAIGAFLFYRKYRRRRSEDEDTSDG